MLTWRRLSTRRPKEFPGMSDIGLGTSSGLHSDQMNKWVALMAEQYYRIYIFRLEVEVTKCSLGEFYLQ